MEDNQDPYIVRNPVFGTPCNNAGLPVLGGLCTLLCIFNLDNCSKLSQWFQFRPWRATRCLRLWEDREDVSDVSVGSLSSSKGETWFLISPLFESSFDFFSSRHWIAWSPFWQVIDAFGGSRQFFVESYIVWFAGLTHGRQSRPICCIMLYCIVLYC